MKKELRLLREGEFAAAGYLWGWAVVGKLPGAWAEKLFDVAADRISDNGRGMEQLRKNLSRVVGPENVTRDLVRAATRSYARYWREAFRLPQIAADPQLHTRLTDGVLGRAAFERSLDKGRGVILALPHSGNWDMAGMWLVRNYGQFTTVAERVKPEPLFQAFVDYRESLGFEVIALTGGDTPPFRRLADVLRSGGVVCLLGERDLKRTGVEVDFFGEKTTMPAGPAQLAIETGAALHVVHSWFTEDTRGPGWGLSASEPLPVTDVETTTQAMADQFAANIAAHPADWHMLQPLWPADRRRRT